jgi:hypothetical protein
MLCARISSSGWNGEAFQSRAFEVKIAFNQTSGEDAPTEMQAKQVRRSLHTDQREVTCQYSSWQTGKPTGSSSSHQLNGSLWQ